MSPLPEVVYLPPFDGRGDTRPIPAAWSAVAEQWHSPPASVSQVAEVHPAAVKAPSIVEHSTDADETVRHADDSGKLIEPLVVVSSE